jgi:phospholipase/carboxylesterase
MMSLHCGLHHAAPPAAIVSFSGALLRHDDLGDGVNYPPVLLVHGTDDQVVPFALQSAAYDVMQSRSIMVETVACEGLGHGIDPDGLSAAIAFLAKYLPA